VHVELVTQDDHGYYSYAFDVFLRRTGGKTTRRPSERNDRTRFCVPVVRPDGRSERASRLACVFDQESLQTTARQS
jgi:hypothetical protein